MLAVQWDDSQNTRCALMDMRASSSSWQPMASPTHTPGRHFPLGTARRYHAVAAVGEHSVVMLGGEDAHEYLTDLAQLYDARADLWSERAEWRLYYPLLGWNCAAVI